MNKKQREEEMYICMKEQGYSFTLCGEIFFDLLYIMIIREILDEEKW